MIFIAEGKSWFILTLVDDVDKIPNLMARKKNSLFSIQNIFYKNKEINAIRVDGVYGNVHKKEED